MFLQCLWFTVVMIQQNCLILQTFLPKPTPKFDASKVSQKLGPTLCTIGPTVIKSTPGHAVNNIFWTELVLWNCNSLTHLCVEIHNKHCFKNFGSAKKIISKIWKLFLYTKQCFFYTELFSDRVSSFILIILHLFVAAAVA